MTITQQQALEALERVYYATHASFIDRNLVRQYIEQSTAQPQAVVPAPEKYDDVLQPFLTLMRKELHANSSKGDRPGWLKMDANTALLEVYWHVAKLSAAVKNNDGPAIQEHSADVANMAMMVLDVCGGLARVEAAQPSAQAERAPVVQAVQAGEYPPLPEGVKARFKCEDCDGTGYTGEMIPGSEFQPPEPVGCTSCRFTGWWAECEAYSADQMHAYLDADRASSCAAQAAPFAKDSWQHAVDNQLVAFGRTSQEFANPHEALAWLAIVNMELGQSNVGAAQAVRMLTREELNDVALSEKVGWGPGEYVEAVQRKFGEVNGLRIPADGKIGDAA